MQRNLKEKIKTVKRRTKFIMSTKVTKFHVNTLGFT